MKHFKIIYYTTKSGDIPIRNFIDSLSQNQKVKIFRIFQVYQIYGLSSLISHTKKLTGTPFWEIRILGRDNIRIIYLVWTKLEILVLHGFLKKRQKTDQKELLTASKRYEDWKSRY